MSHRHHPPSHGTRPFARKGSAGSLAGLLPDGCMIHLELRRQDRGWDMWPVGTEGAFGLPVVAPTWAVVTAGMRELGMVGPYPVEPGDGVMAVTLHVRPGRER